MTSFAFISFSLARPPLSGRVIKGHIIHPSGLPHDDDDDDKNNSGFYYPL